LGESEKKKKKQNSAAGENPGAKTFIERDRAVPSSQEGGTGSKRGRTQNVLKQSKNKREYSLRRLCFMKKKKKTGREEKGPGRKKRGGTNKSVMDSTSIQVLVKGTPV